MNYSCYILFSNSFNRFYIGYTSDIEERIKLHNSGYFGGRSYTKKVSDWTLYLLIPCETISKAVHIESRIKKMKSRKFIENLKEYPEMITKLLNDL
jgi:putative endonuclease